MPNITRREWRVLCALAIAVATTLGVAVFAQTAAQPTASPEVYVSSSVLR